jgi:hypothetical protein
MSRLQFYNTGPDQIPGLIVMSLSDKVASLPDIDPNYEQVVVLFNASDTSQTFSVPGAAGQGFRLHPIQAQSPDATVRQAAFDPASGAFSVPARTTAVFVRGESTRITIAKDARPNSKRNFRFEGNYPGGSGFFNLDDAGSPDGDNYSNSLSATVQPGVYTVREIVPDDWHLGGITCNVADRGVVDMSQAQVTITVYPGDDVTCTFVNEQWAAVLGRVHNDLNGNGRFNIGDWPLPGWWLTLYNADGLEVQRAQASLFGKANFWRLPSGSYTLCGEVRSGWWNTQPATPNPAFGNAPCYGIETEPATATEAWFGYSSSAPAQVRDSAAADGLFQYPSPYWVDSEEASDTPFEDLDINTPLSSRAGMYLPVITR